MYDIPVNYVNNRETFPFWRRGLIDIRVTSVDNSNVKSSISFAIELDEKPMQPESYIGYGKCA